MYLTNCKILSLIVLEVTATAPTKNSYSPANMPRYYSFLVKSPPKFRLCLEIVPVLVSISNINSFSLRKSACSRPASLLKQNHFTFRFRILFCPCVFLHFQYNVLREICSKSSSQARKISILFGSNLRLKFILWKFFLN